MTGEPGEQPPRTLGMVGLLGALALVAAGLLLVSIGVAERERAEPPGSVAVGADGAGVERVTIEVRSAGFSARPLPHVARQGAARRTFGVTLAAAGLGALLALVLFGRGRGASARMIGILAIGFGAYALFCLARGAGAGATTAADAREEFRLWAPLTGLAAILGSARR